MRFVSSHHKNETQYVTEWFIGTELRVTADANGEASGREVPAARERNGAA